MDSSKLRLTKCVHVVVPADDVVRQDQKVWCLRTRANKATCADLAVAVMRTVQSMKNRGPVVGEAPKARRLSDHDRHHVVQWLSVHVEAFDHLPKKIVRGELSTLYLKIRRLPSNPKLAFTNHKSSCSSRT